MGRMDPAVLSVRCARSAEKSVVLMRLPVGCRRNVQGATVICDAVFCALAMMAKKMEPRASCARGVRGDGGADRIAVASTHAGGLDRTRRRYGLQLVIPFAT